MTNINDNMHSMTTFNDLMMPALAYSKKRNIRISKCSVCIMYVIRKKRKSDKKYSLVLTMPALASTKNMQEMNIVATGIFLCLMFLAYT